MNVHGVLPNPGEIANVKSANRSTTSVNHNYIGPNFGESLREIAKSAKMTIANGSTAASLQMARQKEESLEELFSFSEAEKEQADEYMFRIQKLLNQLKK